jgi:phosphoenolpyruvate carboxylase
MRRLARLLSDTGRHDALNRLLQWFMEDALTLDDALRAAGLPTAADCRPALELLHAVRIALIHEIFLLTTRVPRFSTQPNITIEDVVTELLHLDIEPAVDVLQRAFPAEIRQLGDASFGEPATYMPDGDQGYAAEHRELFTPLLEFHAMVRQVSVAITHHLGALG